MKTFDVAIVGGGIIGGSTALELARRGLSVVVLDRQEPGREASWAAAGMLMPAPDSPTSLPLVPLACASYGLYPKFVEGVEADSGKTTGYCREGGIEVFFPPEGEVGRDQMIKERQRLGFSAEAIPLEEARRLEPVLSQDASAAVWMKEEATVDPRALTEAVLAAAARRGVEIRPNSAVEFVLMEGNRATGVLATGARMPAGKVSIATGEKLAAGCVVIAAGCFSSGVGGVEHYAPTVPVRGQMVGFRLPALSLRHVLHSARGYIVPRVDGRVVAGSTLENAGFEKIVTSAGISSILRMAIELVPSLADAAILETWAGLRPDTPDHLPILGPTDIEGLWLATGHYRNGILLAPATAKALAEWITSGNTTLPVDRFSPLRFAEEKRLARS